MYDILALGDMLVSELREVADKFGINHKGLKKQDLIYKILDHQALNPSAAKEIKAKEDQTSGGKDQEAVANTTDAPKGERRKKPRPEKRQNESESAVLHE